MSSNKSLPKADGRAPKGFTLIEVLVAMTILAVGVLGVLGAFHLSMQAASRAFRVDEAAGLAERELQRAIAVPKESLADKAGTEGRYTWTVTITDPPASQRLKCVTVTVRWLERDQGQTFQLSQIFHPME